MLVSESDQPIGTMEKVEAHQKGLLHRAFSIFIFDRAGRLLLQQRAAGKYHGALLWTNTCCSHPALDEDVKSSAESRLQEEMGFTTPLSKIMEFMYCHPVENSLIEHEFDHVFAGEYEGPVPFNPQEVSAIKYIDFLEALQRIKKEESNYTIWFRLILPKLENWWQEKYG